MVKRQRAQRKARIAIGRFYGASGGSCAACKDFFLATVNSERKMLIEKPSLFKGSGYADQQETDSPQIYHRRWRFACCLLCGMQRCLVGSGRGNRRKSAKPVDDEKNECVVCRMYIDSGESWLSLSPRQRSMLLLTDEDHPRHFSVGASASGHRTATACRKRNSKRPTSTRPARPSRRRASSSPVGSVAAAAAAIAVAATPDEVGLSTPVLRRTTRPTKRRRSVSAVSTSSWDDDETGHDIEDEDSDDGDESYVASATESVDGSPYTPSSHDDDPDWRAAAAGSRRRKPARTRTSPKSKPKPKPPVRVHQRVRANAPRVPSGFCDDDIAAVEAHLDLAIERSGSMDAEPEPDVLPPVNSPHDRYGSARAAARQAAMMCDPMPPTASAARAVVRTSSTAVMPAALSTYTSHGNDVGAPTGKPRHHALQVADPRRVPPLSMRGAVSPQQGAIVHSPGPPLNVILGSGEAAPQHTLLQQATAPSAGYTRSSNDAIGSTTATAGATADGLIADDLLSLFA